MLCLQSGMPAVTIITGASYGAGNYAMCGRAYKPRFLFTYPQSKIAVMGPDQLAGVMQTIGRQAAEKSGIIYDEEQGKAMSAYMVKEADKQSNDVPLWGVPFLIVRLVFYIDQYFEQDKHMQ